MYTGSTFPPNSLIKLTIPSTIISIGDSAFQVCSALSEITLTSGLSIIGAFMFNMYLSTSNVVSLTIPSTLTFIGILILSYYYLI